MPRNKKILMFIDQLGSGGAQRQMTELAKGFSGRGYDVSFLVYHDHGFYKDMLEKEGISVMLIEERSYFRRLLKIRKYIRNGGFDAVLSFLPSPSFISCLSGIPRRKWRLVIGERNADPSIVTSRTERIKMRSYVLADYITSNSHANMEMVYSVLPRIDRAKTAVIYNVVDFSRFSPVTQPVRKPDGKFRIVVAARHHHQKNLGGLIEAVRLLSDTTRERLRIEWYGDKNDKTLTDGQEKIADYGLEGVFEFHPPVQQIETVMADADAVGLFSIYEGLPNAVCEGMAMGKPVISTAISDVPFLIGEKKLLCDPHDPASIASALEHLLSLSPEELQRIGNENYQKALELFDKDRILNRYLSLLLA